MIWNSRIDSERAVGRAPEQLSLKELAVLAGKFVALELYTPEKLPFRRIEAIGDSSAEVVTRLMERDLDPRQFEIQVLRRPY